ncbi:uncharacterized protein LOC119678361 [Teleopsis dalmanni]|uniref:uncharacterized protein LOC119678361 n=1 Tax=Teleopsis dalmanni TaxID=139649 RepID=UPI0018CCE543|nr:uncharacterized protein LOC119678361 [Teleopsis dalmanni]XP_037946079.1 uncharacterized protein LOC119678361 [Teleopsis dalmanni]
MSDSEYEDEDSYLVFADFQNQLLKHEVEDCKQAIKIIGLETKNPIAEIKGNIFKGNFDFALATKVFFSDDCAENVAADTLFETSSPQMYSYMGKTNKIIKFERMFIGENTNIEDNSSYTNKNILEDKSTEQNIKLNISYTEAIKTFPEDRQ